VTQSPTLSRRSTSSAPALRKSRQRGADARAGYTFLLPWLLGFIVLTVGPMISSLYLSFTNYNLFDPPKWIGLDNYTTLFQDERFLQSVGVTVSYVCLVPR
jgi:multiple sugar transport system permease protein